MYIYHTTTQFLKTITNSQSYTPKGETQKKYIYIFILTLDILLKRSILEFALFFEVLGTSKPR